MSNSASAPYDSQTDNPAQQSFEIRAFEAPLGAEGMGLALDKPISSTDFELTRTVFL